MVVKGWDGEPALKSGDGEGGDGAQMRHFKEAESVELGNNWLWKRSKWEIRDDRSNLGPRE